MELIFEVLVEALFELIFEGSLELGTSKKVSLPVRILAILVFVIFTVGLLALLLLAALAVMKSSKAAGWLLLLFDGFMLGGVIYTVGKRLKK